MGKFPKAFQRMAVERLKYCDNISEVAKELSVHRRLLYTWRDKLEPIASEDRPPQRPRVSRRSPRGGQTLKRVLADKARNQACHSESDLSAIPPGPPPHPVTKSVLVLLPERDQAVRGSDLSVSHQSGL